MHTIKIPKPEWSRLWEMPMRLPVLLAVSLAATAIFHGARGLYETTEGRYAECAREMAQTGSWLEPVLNGRPHWTKPPLTYLAIREPYRLFGPTTWAARFYVIPCHLIAIAAVWWLAFRLWRDRTSARMCAMVYATTAMPMIASQTISTDYPLTAVLALSQACFWEAFRSRSRAAIHLLWACLGVAFLVKGPPALLAVPAMAAVWLRLPKSERRQLPLFAPTAVALFAAVAFGWYAFEAWRHPGLLSYWFKDEVVNRSFSDKFGRNPHFYQNFVIYLPVLLFGTLPWSGWLALRWKAVRSLCLPRGVRNAWSALSSEAFWLLFAVAVPLCVFMLSRSKLPLYMLPLFVPLAAGAGRLVLATGRQWSGFRLTSLSVAASMFVLFVAGKAGMTLFPSERDMGRLYRTLTEQCGVRDPAKLAVLGDKPLNGLSFYFDYDLRTVPRERAAAWADEGGDRYLLCSGRRGMETVRQLEGHMVEEQKISKKWRLVRIVGPAVASTSRPGDEGTPMPRSPAGPRPVPD